MKPMTYTSQKPMEMAKIAKIAKIRVRNATNFAG
jgi:hypothetical protein